MPLLTIVIPVYNAENYLKPCLDSVAAQEFTDYELVLVDDGSADGSGGYATNMPYVIRGSG